MYQTLIQVLDSVTKTETLFVNKLVVISSVFEHDCKGRAEIHALFPEQRRPNQQH